jgi:hypothetical protein
MDSQIATGSKDSLLWNAETLGLARDLLEGLGHVSVEVDNGVLSLQGPIGSLILLLEGFLEHLVGTANR